MERESVVRDVQVEHEGITHTASYFVEDGMIHGRIGERKLLAPIGPDSADLTVRSLVSEHLQERSRRMRHSDNWSSALHPRFPKLHTVD
nr:hypothetical protein [uncultured Devosia sp.]